VLGTVRSVLCSSFFLFSDRGPPGDLLEVVETALALPFWCLQAECEVAGLWVSREW